MWGKLGGAVGTAVLVAAAPAQALSVAPFTYVQPAGGTTQLSPDVALPVADLAPRVGIGVIVQRVTSVAPGGAVDVRCATSAGAIVPYRGTGTYRLSVEVLDPGDTGCAAPPRPPAATGLLAVQPATALAPLPDAVIRRRYAVVDAPRPYRTATQTLPVPFGAVAGAGSYRVTLTGPDGARTSQVAAGPQIGALRLPPPGRYALTAAASPSAPGAPGAIFTPESAPTILRVRDEFAPVAKLSGVVKRQGRGFALGGAATTVRLAVNPQLRAGERVTLALSRLHGRRFGKFTTRARGRVVADGARRVVRARIRPGAQGIYRLRVSYSGGPLVARRALVVYVLRLT